MMCRLQRQVGEGADDADGVDADAGDAANEVDDATLIIVFAGPIVGVIHHAGGLVGLHLVAVDEPAAS